jgi:hypothetical protein
VRWGEVDPAVRALNWAWRWMMPPAGRILKARWQGPWPAAWGFDRLSLSGGKGCCIEGWRSAAWGFDRLSLSGGKRRGIEGRWFAGWGFDGLSLSGGKGRGIEGRRICMEWNRQNMSLPAGGIFG